MVIKGASRLVTLVGFNHKIFYTINGFSQLKDKLAEFNIDIPNEKLCTIYSEKDGSQNKITIVHVLADDETIEAIHYEIVG